MASKISKQIRAFAKQHAIDAREVAKTTMFNISKDITSNSPVDTGRFRSNWIATISAPSSRQLKTTSRKPMTSANKKIGVAVKRFGVYYFVNNLPYAKSLEYGLYKKNPIRGTRNRKTGRYEIRSKNGYSKQAPTGLVRVAIKRELRRFNKMSKNGRLTTKSSGIRYWDK